MTEGISYSKCLQLQKHVWHISAKLKTVSDLQQKYIDFCHKLPTLVNHVLLSENLFIAMNINSL